MRYPLGQPVRLSTEVRDVSGTLVDPTTIVVHLQLPDLTTVTFDSGSTPAVTKGGTGTYTLDYTGALAGRHQYYWQTTGSGAGVTQPAGFDLVDPFTPAHISYEDARARLNLSSSVPDPEVQDMVASAVSEQERWVGAVAPRRVTETLTARGGRLWPTVRPVLSITSATLSGVGQSVTAWAVGPGDLIQSTTHLLTGTYVVTYVAGRNPIPPDLVEAALLRVQHSYGTQRGGAGGQIIGSPSADVSSGAEPGEFLFMLRARDKEAPYHLPVVA